MFKKIGFLTAGVLAATLLHSGTATAQDSTPGATPNAMAVAIIGNFRRNILLHEAHPAKLTRAQAAAGHYLFFQNRRLAALLVETLAADAAACEGFVEQIETTPEWREIDRLALGGVLLELSLRLPPAAACAVQAQWVRARLAAIRVRYSTEISAALGARVSGARAQRRDWQNYLAFLHQQYARQSWMPTLDAEPAAPAKVGEPPLTELPLARQAERDEWTDGGLPPRTVLLTFDDGPHPVHTPKILDILARYRIKAVFFQVGQNIGTQDSAGGVVLREPQISARILADGHTVANHSHSHPMLPELNAVRVAEEIDRAEVLVSAALRGGISGERGGERSGLFRPPYGARNDLVLAELSQRGLRSVLWNIDSRDWADPLARSVAQRVIDETLREGRGIVLFHDIHARAVDALPTVIEELQKRGFKFARFERGRLVPGGD